MQSQTSTPAEIANPSEYDATILQLVLDVLNRNLVHLPLRPSIDQHPCNSGFGREPERGRKSVRSSVVECRLFRLSFGRSQCRSLLYPRSGIDLLGFELFML